MRYLHKLTDNDFLDIAEENDPEVLKQRNVRKPFLKWKLKETTSFSLPMWEELLDDNRFTENLTDKTLKTIETDKTNMTDLA